MKISIRLDNWETQQPAAYAVRKAVFVVEQQIPDELEWDDMDLHCIHAVATDEQGVPVGTGRLLPDGRIGRMAVLASARGLNVGGLILQALMQTARQRGDQRAVLSAQVQAEGFYARYGYTRIGAEYAEADIAHIEMEHFYR